MALIKCSECGKEISDKATTCIQCGAPLKTNNQISVNRKRGDRRCLTCNYEGQMKTWLRNYSLPQIIFLVLLCVYMLPGIVFLFWAWGKYKCPKCDALAKNVKI